MTWPECGRPYLDRLQPYLTQRQMKAIERRFIEQGESGFRRWRCELDRPCFPRTMANFLCCGCVDDDYQSAIRALPADGWPDPDEWRLGQV